MLSGDFQLLFCQSPVQYYLQPMRGPEDSGHPGHTHKVSNYSWFVLKRNQSKNRAPHWIGQHTQPLGIYIKSAAQQKEGYSEG